MSLPSLFSNLASNSPPNTGRDDVPDAAQRVRLPARLLQQPGVQACKSATGFAAFCALCAGTGLLLACGLRPEYRRAEAEAEAVEAEQVGGYTGVTYGTL